MVNKENLIPMNKRTPEEVKRIASMGGKAVQKKKREKKLFKEAVKILFSGRVKDKELQECLKELGYKSDDFNNQAKFIMSMYNYALNGNMQAAKILVDSLDEDNQVYQTDEDDSVFEMLVELRYRNVVGVEPPVSDEDETED